MKTITERIKLTEQRLKQLKTQSQKIESRIRSETTKKMRADDTRRKILVGALLLELAATSSDEKAQLWRRLDNYLTRGEDRKLFDLSPRTIEIPSFQDEAS